MEPIIQATNISHHYRQQASVKELSLTLSHGEVMALLGTNGAGKTTTLRLLTGDLAPDAGKITINNIDLNLHPRQAKKSLGCLPDTAPFKVARKEDTWVAVIQGHGERDPLDAGNNGLSKLVSELNKTGIKVQPINLLSQAVIPDNTKVLIIAGARNAYLGGELKLIEEFINKGGNLLWLRDPAKQNYFASLDDLLGLSLVPGVVIDANTKLRILLGIKHAAVIPVTEFHKHSITEQLKTHLLFPFASAIDHQASSGWQVNKLFKSLDRSWSEIGEINTDKLKYEQELGDTQGPLTIGISLSREIEQQQQRVVVIGDSDFMANGYIGFGANFALSLNILNWLTEDDKLLSITHQSAPDQSLELADKDVTFIALILLLLVPATLIGTGFAIR